MVDGIDNKLNLLLCAAEPRFDKLCQSWYCRQISRDSEGTVYNRRGDGASLLEVGVQGCGDLCQGVIGVGHHRKVENLGHHFRFGELGRTAVLFNCSRRHVNYSERAIFSFSDFIHFNILNVLKYTSEVP